MVQQSKPAGPLTISIEQYYADGPMKLTLTQEEPGPKGKVYGMTFTVGPKDALRLVAILAPLAGKVLS